MAGYYLYATQQDVAPTNTPAATGVPVVNYLQGVIYSVTARRETNDAGSRLVASAVVRPA